jgi:hypothetical protein
MGLGFDQVAGPCCEHWLFTSTDAGRRDERSGARAATMVREALPGVARESDSWRLDVGLSTR